MVCRWVMIMPRVAKRLTDKEVKALSKIEKNALYSVGGVTGLALQVKHYQDSDKSNKWNHSSSWILRVVAGLNRRTLGLGSYQDVSLAKARTLAEQLRFKIKFEGLDPIQDRKDLKAKCLEEKELEKEFKTFKDMAELYIDKKSNEYKNPIKQIKRLTYQLETYAYPSIGNLQIKDIEIGQITEFLKPIWLEKFETANRVRIHVSKIFDMAIASKDYTELNPARWVSGLENFLTKRDKAHTTMNRESLPVAKMPELWSLLEADGSQSSKALRLIILTSSRYVEVCKMNWSEIDMKAKVWTKPKENTKNSKQHRVPLSNKAIKLLKALPRDSKLVFPNRDGNVLSDVAITKTHRKYGFVGKNGQRITTHGFRSTFKDWARKLTNYPDELSEIQLHHKIGDSTHEAYARDDLIEKRQQLVDDWANYCQNGKQFDEDNVRAIGA